MDLIYAQLCKLSDCFSTLINGFPSDLISPDCQIAIIDGKGEQIASSLEDWLKRKSTAVFSIVHASDALIDPNAVYYPQILKGQEWCFKVEEKNKRISFYGFIACDPGKMITEIYITADPIYIKDTAFPLLTSYTRTLYSFLSTVASYCELDCLSDEKIQIVSTLRQRLKRLLDNQKYSFTLPLYLNTLHSFMQSDIIPFSKNKCWKVLEKKLSDIEHAQPVQHVNWSSYFRVMYIGRILSTEHTAHNKLTVSADGLMSNGPFDVHLSIRTACYSKNIRDAYFDINIKVNEENKITNIIAHRPVKYQCEVTHFRDDATNKLRRSCVSRLVSYLPVEEDFKKLDKYMAAVVLPL